MSTRLGISLVSMVGIPKLREFISNLNVHNEANNETLTLPHSYNIGSVNGLAFLPTSIYKSKRFGTGNSSDYWPQTNSNLISSDGYVEFDLEEIAFKDPLNDINSSKYFIYINRKKYDLFTSTGYRSLVKKNQHYLYHQYKTSSTPKDIVINYTISMKLLIASVISICSGKSNMLVNNFLYLYRKLYRPQIVNRLNRLNFCYASSPLRLTEDFIKDSASLSEFCARKGKTLSDGLLEYCTLFIGSVEHGLQGTDDWNGETNSVRYGSYMKVNILDLIQYLMIRSVLNPKTKYMRIGPKAMMRNIVDELFEWIRLNIIVSAEELKGNDKLSEIFDDEGRTFTSQLKQWYECNQSVENHPSSASRSLPIVFNGLNINRNMLILSLLSPPFISRDIYAETLEDLLRGLKETTQTSIMGFSNIKVLDYLERSSTTIPNTFYALVPTIEQFQTKLNFNSQMSSDLRQLATLKRRKVMESINSKAQGGIK